MEVLLIASIEGLEDKGAFEGVLKKEGLECIEDEEFAYMGETTTSLLHTKTFLLHVCKEALMKGGFKEGKIIFQIGENPMEAYVYDHGMKDFVAVKSA